MVLRALLQQARLKLEAAKCDSARLDAEVLWMHVSNYSKTDLIVHAMQEVNEELLCAFNQCIDRRCAREPVAYITGTKEFWSRDFQVNPHVLIPRPETEHLIELALQYFPDRQHPWLFADIGTGSGIIATILACQFPNATLFATDISSNALAVAKKNSAFHDVAHQIDFVEGDLLQPLPHDVRFDGIFSNPPYIALEEMAALETELHFEPEQALTDMDDGLKCMRGLIQDAPKLLKKNGILCIETGPCGYIDAENLPSDIILNHTYPDLAGHIRGVVYRAV